MIGSAWSSARAHAALAETPTPTHEDVVAVVKEEAAEEAEQRAAVEKAVHDASRTAQAATRTGG